MNYCRCSSPNAIDLGCTRSRKIQKRRTLSGGCGKQLDGILCEGCAEIALQAVAGRLPRFPAPQPSPARGEGDLCEVSVAASENGSGRFESRGGNVILHQFSPRRWESLAINPLSPARSNRFGLRAESTGGLSARRRLWCRRIVEGGRPVGGKVSSGQRAATPCDGIVETCRAATTSRRF